MIVRFIVLISLLFLTACSVPPLVGKLMDYPRERETFLNALEQLNSKQDLSGLKAFQQNYPDSDLAFQAEAIGRRVQRLRDKTAELSAAELENQQQAEQLAELLKENEQLNEQIAQLKKLLIELEQRPR